MNAMRRGMSLLLVVAVVALLGMFGVLATQLSRDMLIEHSQAQAEGAARQLIVSGLGWAQLHMSALRQAGDWIDLPTDRLVEPPTEASLRVRLERDASDSATVVVDVHVQRSKSAVNRTILHSTSPLTTAPTSQPALTPT